MAFETASRDRVLVTWMDFDPDGARRAEFGE